MNIRAGFIGCVASSEVSLRALLKVPAMEVCAVISARPNSSISDFVDLSPICAKENIPIHFEESGKKDLSKDFLESHKLDVIFCVGWSRLLDKEILSLTPHGVVGFHPADLPSNRGRHPIVWALTLGLQKTASTFFLMDEGADSGPILSQEPVDILNSDNATSLYEKILKVAEKQVFEIGSDLVSGNLSSIKQDHSLANTWRKRGYDDGVIDFRMPAQSIHNLIRALAPPYPGAEFNFNGSQIKVIDSIPLLDGIPVNFEPGKVLEIKDSAILVKSAGSGAIWLLDIVDEGIFLGAYL